MVAFLDKFKHAFRGLRIGFKDKSILLQVCFMVLAILLFSFLKLSAMEWICVIVACSLVLLFEFANTIVEKMLNFMQPEYHEEVKKIKDLSAGMVLLAAFFACIIGILVLWGKL